MKGLLIGIMGAFVIGAGILVAGGAGAQEGESERRGDRFIAETAERLGVTPEELTTAMKDAQFEIIDGKVAEGALIEEQAAKLKERIEEYGPLSAVGLKHRDGHKAVCRGAKLVVDAAAEVLGLNRAEIAEAVRSGQSLASIAEGQGMSVEEFTAALLSAIKAQFDAKVAEGAIMQEQADRIFAGIEKHVDRIVNFEGQGGDGPCHRRGDRGERPAEGDRQSEASPGQ